MTLLDVQHVKKIYKTRFKGNQVEALKDIHFTVEKGEYVAIMGESGSGKSTLMNIIGLLDQPTTGSYQLEGENVAELSENRLAKVRNDQIGFIFQQYNLVPMLDVYENITLPIRLDGGKLDEAFLE